MMYLIETTHFIQSIFCSSIFVQQLVIARLELVQHLQYQVVFRTKCEHREPFWSPAFPLSPGRREQGGLQGRPRPHPPHLTAWTGAWRWRCGQCPPHCSRTGGRCCQKPERCLTLKAGEAAASCPMKAFVSSSLTLTYSTLLRLIPIAASRQWKKKNELGPLQFLASRALVLPLCRALVDWSWLGRGCHSSWKALSWGGFSPHGCIAAPCSGHDHKKVCDGMSRGFHCS